MISLTLYKKHTTVLINPDDISSVADTRGTFGNYTTIILRTNGKRIEVSEHVNIIQCLIEKRDQIHELEMRISCIENQLKGGE